MDDFDLASDLAGGSIEFISGDCQILKGAGPVALVLRAGLVRNGADHPPERRDLYQTYLRPFPSVSGSADAGKAQPVGLENVLLHRCALRRGPGRN